VIERRDRVTWGVQAFARLDDPDASHRVIAAGQLVDRLGLDAFYVGDHPGYTTDPWTHLAALAVTTERVILGSVVGCVLYRNPVVTARLASDLDRLSNGRFMLGLGCGWMKDEFAALGIPYHPASERQAALEEAVAIIEGVWGDAPFSFSGDHYAVTDARVFPPPLQQPRPPLMIAGGGERVTLRQVARLADACNFIPADRAVEVGVAEEARHKFAVLRQHCAEVGRNYDDILRTHFTGWLMLAPTEAAAEAKLARYFPDGLTERQRHDRLALTPAQAIAHYQSLADAGVQHFVIQSLDAGDHETFELLAREVVPGVRAVER
jgi:alkanesulfonate monooxygenase SsuD/methylene tetrahydromethanopterin reductase-like flavin-dependent oxidoreductase (luciferase family)